MRPPLPVICACKGSIEWTLEYYNISLSILYILFQFMQLLKYLAWQKSMVMVDNMNGKPLAINKHRNTKRHSDLENAFLN